MKQHRLSLKAFLNACFPSQSKYIQGIVQSYYRDNGPAEAIDLWQKQIIRPNHRERTVPAAVNFALEHIKDELERTSQDKALHFPVNGITQEKIKGCSKDPSIAVPVIASVFAFLCNCRCNYLQLMLGLYLF
ncbi:hypothetical protein BCR41DRAFT_390022, partial [Lobosporangium transversale]